MYCKFLDSKLNVIKVTWSMVQKILRIAIKKLLLHQNINDNRLEILNSIYKKWHYK